MRKRERKIRNSGVIQTGLLWLLKNMGVLLVLFKFSLQTIHWTLRHITALYMQVNPSGFQVAMPQQFLDLA